MTREQEKLIEDNHNLIYHFIRKYLDGNIEEWYGIAALGLCKAALHYNPKNKTKFSTYAYIVMQNEAKQEIRYRNSHRNQLNEQAVSLDSIVYQGEDGSELTLQDILPDKVDIADDCVTKMLAKSLLQEFSDRDKNMIIMSILGYKQRDIAKEMNISQSYVSRILVRFKDKLLNTQ